MIKEVFIRPILLYLLQMLGHKREHRPLVGDQRTRRGFHHGASDACWSCYYTVTGRMAFIVTFSNSFYSFRSILFSLLESSSSWFRSCSLLTLEEMSPAFTCKFKFLIWECTHATSFKRQRIKIKWIIVLFKSACRLQIYENLWPLLKAQGTCFFHYQLIPWTTL